MIMIVMIMAMIIVPGGSPPAVEVVMITTMVIIHGYDGGEDGQSTEDNEKTLFNGKKARPISPGTCTSRHPPNHYYSQTGKT